MRRIALMTILLMGVACPSFAQNMGLSFSYFIPRNGSFSTPISPFSIRGVGFDLHKNIAIESGFSLYRMTGLNIIDLPFASEKPLTGPNFTLFIPVELIFRIIKNKFQIDIKGGGFFFYGFDQYINYGNMDRALQRYTGWDIVNSAFSFENYPGGGYHFGGLVSYQINDRFGISVECNYLIGQSQFPLQGNYSGGKLNSSNQTKEADFGNAKIDFTGLEFSIGVFFTSK